MERIVDLVSSPCPAVVGLLSLGEGRRQDSRFPASLPLMMLRIDWLCDAVLQFESLPLLRSVIPLFARLIFWIASVASLGSMINPPVAIVKLSASVGLRGIFTRCSRRVDGDVKRPGRRRIAGVMMLAVAVSGVVVCAIAPRRNFGPVAPVESPLAVALVAMSG